MALIPVHGIDTSCCSLELNSPGVPVAAWCPGTHDWGVVKITVDISLKDGGTLMLPLCCLLFTPVAMEPQGNRAAKCRLGHTNLCQIAFSLYKLNGLGFCYSNEGWLTRHLKSCSEDQAQ